MACFHLHLKGDGTNNTSVIAMASLVHTGTGVGFLILIGGGAKMKEWKSAQVACANSTASNTSVLISVFMGAKSKALIMCLQTHPGAALFTHSKLCTMWQLLCRIWWERGNTRWKQRHNFSNYINKKNKTWLADPGCNMSSTFSWTSAQWLRATGSSTKMSQ